jgi:hypothetical protein
VLTRDDFGYAPKPAEPANDLIDKGTWDSIVTLPDDVAVRTTNYHGKAIRQLHDLWGAWIDCVGEEHDFMFPVMLDAADDFQAATYTALTGYYRLSIAALRSALELVSIGAWAQVCGKHQELADWRSGKKKISLGQACDGLIQGAQKLEFDLRQLVGDTLFAQKHRSVKEGSLAESSMESQTSPTRVPDQPTAICAEATDRSTSARPSITLAGSSLRCLPSAMFLHCLHGPNCPRPHRRWSSLMTLNGQNRASRGPHFRYSATKSSENRRAEAVRQPHRASNGRECQP